MKDGKDGKDVGDCLDGKFGDVGMEIRLVALPIEVEVTRIEGKAHSQRDKHLYKSASDHDGHGDDEGDELEEGQHFGGSRGSKVNDKGRLRCFMSVFCQKLRQKEECFGNHAR